MKSVFLDTSTILRIAIPETKEDIFGAKLLTFIENGTVFGATSTVVLSQVNNILNSQEFLRKLRLLLFILPVDEKIVQKALEAKWNNYNSSVDYYTALQGKTDVIISNIGELYKKGTLPVQTPREFFITSL